MKKLLCFLTLLIALFIVGCQKNLLTPGTVVKPSVTVGTTVLASDSFVKSGTNGIEVLYLIKNTSAVTIKVSFAGAFAFKNGMTIANIRNYYLKQNKGPNYLLPPTAPLATNPYGPELMLDAGQTGEAYIGFSLNNDTIGSVIPSLLVKIRIDPTILTPAPPGSGISVDTTTVFMAPTVGQTFTIKSAPPPPLPLIVPTPTLGSGSTQAGYVASGTSTGVIDATKNTFNMVFGGTVTKTVWKVTNSNSSPSVYAIRIGNVTAPVVGDSVVLTGLAIATTASGTGTSIDAYASYLPVNNISGVVSGTQSTIRLVSVTASSGSQTATVSCNVSYPIQTLVGSKQTVSTNTTPMTGLTTTGAEVLIAMVTVTSDANGSTATVQQKYLISSTGFNTSGVTLSNPRLANTAGITIPQSNATVHNTAASGTDYITCSLSSSPVNPPGQSKTYYLYAKVTGTPTGATFSLSTALDPSGYLWVDTAGGSTGVYDGNPPFANFPVGIKSTITQ